MDLSIDNVISVGVLTEGTGLGEYNTSNIGLFTREAHAASFGTKKYKIYLSPTEVAIDFGSDSVTYKMALKCFSQQPNILNGNGYLAIIKLNDAVPGVTAKLKLDSFVADAGSFKIKINSFETAAINFDADEADIQAALIAAGLANAVVTLDNGFVIDSGLQLPVTDFSIEDNTLENATNPVDLNLTLTTNGSAPIAAESIVDGYNSSKVIVQFFGVVHAMMLTPTEAELLADIIQTENKMFFVVTRSKTEAFEDNGLAHKIAQKGQDQTRVLYYGDLEIVDSLGMLMAYVARMLCVNFNASESTLNMHMKDLIGVLADSTITQTDLISGRTSGVDFYASFQGVAKVFTSGANNFADQPYNRLWLVGAVSIAYFNYVAQTGTKIPQTEAGMDGAKAKITEVLERAVTNGYLAAGKWTRPEVFGNQLDFLRNISQFGFYIWSVPVAKQSQSERDDRIAPFIYIAGKEAGAINKGNVLIALNK